METRKLLEKYYRKIDKAQIDRYGKTLTIIIDRLNHTVVYSGLNLGNNTWRYAIPRKDYDDYVAMIECELFKAIYEEEG